MNDPESERTESTIEVSPGGPYRVRGLEALQNSLGAALEIKPIVALCRCGQSANKPFCDGTHKRIEFSDANESDPLKRHTRDYAAPGITVHDRRWICSHAAECIRGLPDVWRKGSKPWIVPEAGAVQEIVDVIHRCPSGALGYTVMSGSDAIGAVGSETSVSRDPSSPASAAATIRVEKNGPYHVTGGPLLKDPTGIEPPVREHYTLCRCGHSKNKPFCDGSHANAGFVDEVN